jgi:hypothetical protein
MDRHPQRVAQRVSQAPTVGGDTRTPCSAKRCAAMEEWDSPASRLASSHAARVPPMSRSALAKWELVTGVIVELRKVFANGVT